MQKPDIQKIKDEFTARWLMKVQELYYLRKSKLSQLEMSRVSGRSVKTIQRFERGECIDAELMYLYKHYLEPL